MGRAIDLFVTYRFLKLLTTPFDKTDAYKFGIIDDKMLTFDTDIKLPIEELSDVHKYWLKEFMNK